MTKEKIDWPTKKDLYGDTLEFIVCKTRECQNLHFVGDDRFPDDDGWYLIGFGVWYCPNCKPIKEKNG